MVDNLQRQDLDKLMSEAFCDLAEREEPEYDENGELIEKDIEYSDEEIFEAVERVAECNPGRYAIEWQADDGIYLNDTDMDNPRAEHFADEKSFIAYTIAAAKKDAQKGDEAGNMESWGFSEVVDKMTYDEDGDVDEYESHYEGSFYTCLRYWNVNKKIKVYSVSDGEEQELWYDIMRDSKKVKTSLENLYYYGECDKIAAEYLASQGIKVYPDEDGVIWEYDRFEKPYTSADDVEEEIKRTDIDIDGIWEGEWEGEKESYMEELAKIKEKFQNIEKICKDYLEI